jgi:hypothetical protein
MPSLTASMSDDADTFESALLEFLRTKHQLAVERGQGTNSQYFRTVYKGKPVDFSIVSSIKNTATPPKPGVSWLLRAEESEPADFVDLLQSLFKAGSALVRTMPNGKLRAQWKSSDYIGGL